MDISPAPQVVRGPAARRWPPRPLLTGAAVAVGAAVPLTVLTAAVVSGDDTIGALDQDTAQALHRLVVERPEWATILGWLSVATHPNVMRIAAAAVAVLLWRRRQTRAAVWLAVTMTVGGLLAPLMKELVGRDRPVFTDPVAVAGGYSFPSGHALNSMLFAACLVVLGHRFLRRRTAHLAVLWVGAATLVAVTGFDRIALGVHYLSDVVAGWLVALATLGATTVAFESRRREDPPAS